MGDADGKEQKEEPKKIVHTYPLVRVSHRIKFISILYSPFCSIQICPRKLRPRRWIWLSRLAKSFRQATR